MGAGHFPTTAGRKGGDGNRSECTCKIKKWQRLALVQADLPSLKPATDGFGGKLLGIRVGDTFSVSLPLIVGRVGTVYVGVLRSGCF